MSNDLSRKPIQTYALVVCFAALVIGGLSLGIAVYDVVQINLPELTNPLRDFSPPVATVDGINASIATQLRPPSNEMHVALAQQSLIRCVIAIVISSVFFGFHWRLAKRYASNQDE